MRSKEKRKFIYKQEFCPKRIKHPERVVVLMKKLPAFILFTALLGTLSACGGSVSQEDVILLEDNHEFTTTDEYDITEVISAGESVTADKITNTVTEKPGNTDKISAINAVLDLNTVILEANNKAKRVMVACEAALTNLAVSGAVLDGESPATTEFDGDTAESVMFGGEEVSLKEYLGEYNGSALVFYDPVNYTVLYAVWAENAGDLEKLRQADDDLQKIPIQLGFAEDGIVYGCFPLKEIENKSVNGTENTDNAKKVYAACSAALTKLAVSGIILDGESPATAEFDGSSTGSVKFGGEEASLKEYLEDDYYGYAFAVYDPVNYTVLYAVWTENAGDLEKLRRADDLNLALTISKFAEDGITYSCYPLRGVFDINENTIESADKNAKEVYTACSAALIKLAINGVVLEGENPEIAEFDENTYDSVSFGEAAYSVYDYLGVYYYGSAFVVYEPEKYTVLYAVWTENAGSIVTLKQADDLTSEATRKKFAENGILYGCYPFNEE